MSDVTLSYHFLSNARGFTFSDGGGATWSFDKVTNKLSVALSVAAGSVADDAISNAKLANMAQATIKGRAAAAGSGDPVDLTAAQVNTILDIASGTYTPTLTNITNLDGSTAFVCQYLRVGSIVYVSGLVNVDPTASAADTELGISLPVASDLASIFQLAGTAVGYGSQAAAIRGDDTNNRAHMRWASNTTANGTMCFHFMYQVI